MLPLGASLLVPHSPKVENLGFHVANENSAKVNFVDLKFDKNDLG